MQEHNYPNYPFLGVIMTVIWSILLAPLQDKDRVGNWSQYFAWIP